MPPRDVLEQAQDALQALQQINPNFQVGDISLSALENAIGLVTSKQAQISAVEAQLTDMRNERGTLNAALWDTLKRLRSGIKAAYGDDSSQYEMIGGTRLSEKKRPVRKAPEA